MSECYPTGCNPCDSPIEFPKYPVDNFNNPDGDVDLTQTPDDQSLEAGKTYRVTVASASQDYLDDNYPGLTHTVPVETRIQLGMGTDAQWYVASSTRYCVDIGSMGEKKCWVYDKCIPGWRAEGPSASPTRYRGGVNVKTQAPGYEDTDLPIAAGDWYIQNATDINGDPIDVTSPYQQGWGLQLGAKVENGARIAFNGSVWQQLPPPNVPYADEALDAVPTPNDTRMGGIVKLAAKDQALAGTNKCDAITPYTLQQKLDEDLVDFSPTKPQTVTATIVEGNSVSVCVNKNTLTLTCEAKATTQDGKPALGRFSFQWVETTSGTAVPLQVIRTETVTGSDSRQLVINDYTASPSTLVRKFQCNVVFTDLFSVDHPASSSETAVSLAQALKISGQPADLDLSGSTTTGTFTVTVEQFDPVLSAIVPTYTWMINGVDITGGSVPGNTGYTFSAFTTNVLTVTRADADAGNYTISCKVTGGTCNDGGLVSGNALLKGPGGSNSDVPDVPLPSPGSVGAYAFVVRNQIATIAPGTNFSGSQLLGTGLSGTWKVMDSFLTSGSYISDSPQQVCLVLRIS